ncbi:hypothetical protein L6164_013445 [Bauhinia variegata]|uniref:Uncharacterized protein n=1 Tax=Bauhinia variegata TaxID=167791 RepID=A0ACB9NEC5_BAUVA|nr:hypothetical protein L6164_013445 [Bauhinia variegata]
MPHKWFLDKSRTCNDFNCPMAAVISPLIMFLEMFKDINPTRSMISFGISPLRLLLERSILFNNPSVSLNTDSLPFHMSDSLY